MKRLLRIVPIVVLAALAAWPIAGCSKGRGAAAPTVRAVRGSVTRKAIAVGRIEVQQEIPVNSPHPGILTKLFVRQGQKVSPGDPLAEVRPVPTEDALLGAERALTAAQRGEESALEYLEEKHLASRFTRFFMGERSIERMHEQAVLGRKQAEEQLELLKSGKAAVEGRTVDFVIRSSVEANVLQINTREGTPIVPASAYGTGTVFMHLADMGRLLFRGTVNEIDVGRLREGMRTRIVVGALPGSALAGTLAEIALRGRERNNAMVFDVVIDLEIPADLALRAGYSAVAEIELERRDDVLVVPERLVEYRAGAAGAIVLVADGRGGSVKREITTGLSDGLTVEVVEGLTAGEELVERVSR